MKTRIITSLTLTLLILAFSLLFGSVLFFRLFILSALLLSTCYLWVTLSLRNLSVKAALPPEHLQVDDNFQREVTVNNINRFPRLWLKLQDQTDLGKQDETIISLSGRGSFSWKTNFSCSHRGLYHLGPVTVTSADPLGVFAKQITLGEPQNVLIYPKTVDLPHFKFSSFSDFGYGNGYQSISRISPNASSVREFASGDSLHHIHWKSTLRTGKLMVKMFDADRSYNASKTGWILLDMNEDAHYGRGNDTSDEQAITIAASVIKNYIQGGMRVGIMASDANQTLISPEHGDSQLWHIFEKLALMKTDWKLNLNSVVNANQDKIKDNPLVIIISTTASENLMETIHQLRNRADSVVVILIDVASWRGSPLLTGISRSLTWAGAQVYTVYKGDELAKALDSKITHLYPAVV